KSIVAPLIRARSVVQVHPGPPSSHGPTRTHGFPQPPGCSSETSRFPNLTSHSLVQPCLDVLPRRLVACQLSKPTGQSGGREPLLNWNGETKLKQKENCHRRNPQK